MMRFGHSVLPTVLVTALIIFQSLSGAHAQEAQGLVLPFKLVSVSSPVTQDIIRVVSVEEGDSVREGQVLAQLDSAKEVLDVEQCKKQVERREFVSKGMDSLLQDKMVSQENALEKKTDLELARIQTSLALERLNEKTIKSPISGIVVKKYKEVGEGVDRVEKLFDIINIDKVYIQFYLDPGLMDSVKVGDRIPVRFSIPPASKVEHLAEVTFVEPRIDAASNLFRIKLIMENGNHEIKAGMQCTANFDKGANARGHVPDHPTASP